MVETREQAAVARSAAVPAVRRGRGRVFRPGSPRDRPQLASPEQAAAVVAPLLEGLDREHCLLLPLDTCLRLIAVTTVSVGTAGHTFMGPREVFRDALAAGASSVFVAHNHPWRPRPVAGGPPGSPGCSPAPARCSASSWSTT